MIDPDKKRSPVWQREISCHKGALLASGVVAWGGAGWVGEVLCAQPWQPLQASPGEGLVLGEPSGACLVFPFLKSQGLALLI